MNKMPRDIRKKLDPANAAIDSSFKSSLKNQLFNKEATMPETKSKNIFQLIKDYQSVPLYGALLAILVVGGVSALVTNSQSQKSQNASIEIPADLDGLVDLETIQAKALSDEPELSVAGIELENEDGRLLYKVKYSDGSFRVYNAQTGEEVVNDTSLEVDDSVPAGFTAGISLASARQIAQNERPGKTITKIELETENGVVVYSVRFSDDGRVDVNATDGTIVRVKNANGASTSSPADSNDDSSDSDDHSSDDSSHDSSDDDHAEDEHEDEDESDHDDDDKEDDDKDSSNSGSGSSN